MNIVLTDSICHNHSFVSSLLQDQPELRTGYFTPEENEYCIAVIQDFKRGYLNTIQGQTISTYLAKKLGCKVLRIQKKYPALLHLKPFRLVKMNGQDDIEQEVEDARVSVSLHCAAFGCLHHLNMGFTLFNRKILLLSTKSALHPSGGKPCRRR